MLRPRLRFEPENTFAVAATANHVRFAVTVDIGEGNIGCAANSSDDVLSPRLAGWFRALPPGKGPATRIAEENVVAAITVHIPDVEVMWPAIGASAGDHLSRERPLPALRRRKPRDAIVESRAADAAGDDGRAARPVDVTNRQAVNAVEVAIDDMKGPRSRRTGVLKPGDTEVRSLWFRRRLSHGDSLAMFDPWDLVAAEYEVEIAVAIHIECHAV